MSALDDLTSMAESYGYQLRTRLWRDRDLWWADALVLDHAGQRMAYQREKARLPVQHMERVATHTLAELRRVHKARWREG